MDVVEEAWERVIGDGDIDGEDRDPHRCVVPVPLDDPIEERAQHPEALPDRVPRRWLARGGDVGDEEQLEPFDMDSANIDEPAELGVLGDEEPGEATQRVVRHVDGRGAHRHGQLIQITPGSDGEQRCVRDHEIPVVMAAGVVVGGLSEGSEGAHRRIPTLASIRSLAR